MEGRDSLGVWDGYVHTAIFKMENQQGPTVERREPCSVLRGSLDGRGVWRRMGTCTCMAESLHCSSNYHNTVNQIYPNTTGVGVEKNKKMQYCFSFSCTKKIIQLYLEWQSQDLNIHTYNSNE